ncbi:TonB-dependent receptor [Massilia forsythiae]|uniref:TonB-dependent receptor n=1 Tax=Massilia forsythiae TaxID=2728020 RepID=A0A7Z2VZI9_9BURK|nr:TonB-dependent receptor [Massilia forsythiae]QJE02009.1 TonB-dependent receptor [Massilia forsythiae]
MRTTRKTAIALGVAQLLACTTTAAAQADPQTTQDQAGQPGAPAAGASVVVVSGQRAALQSAQQLKKNADEVVDSIVAADIGKLPDRSVTEVLQRIPGITIDRQMSRGDPEHFSVEGSGVTVRGLTYVRSELNGRDSFSANGGRSLNFEDVPPELMAGVDVYKNPSAEQIEGGISGLINLRTALPFDFKGAHAALSVEAMHSTLKKGKPDPSGSIMFSNRWKTPLGEWGVLVDLASSESGTRTDAFQVEPYYPRSDVVSGKTVWIPKGAQWRTLDFDRKRQGAYAALQWKLDNNLRSHLTYFKSKYRMNWGEQAFFASSSPYDIRVTDATYDRNGALLTGTLTDPVNNGIPFGDAARAATRRSSTTDIAWNVEWKPASDWTLTSDLQRVKAVTNGFDSTVGLGVLMPRERLDLRADLPQLVFDAADKAYLANPANYYWGSTMEHLDSSSAIEKAWKGDVKYAFDHPLLRDVRFGVRLTERSALTRNSDPSYNWTAITQPWQVGWDILKPAYLGDPRFAGAAVVNAFPNFFNGKVSVPAIVFPDLSLASGYPSTYEALHKFHDILCAERLAAQGGGGCTPWKAATFGGDNPSGTNDQSERTKAFYTQLRFGVDDWRWPVDGNLGVRYVKTDSHSRGYLSFTPTTPNLPANYRYTGVPFPTIPAFARALDYENGYHNLLPSLNLRLKASDTLQFRLAYGTSMSRPDFSQLQAYTTLSQDVSGQLNDATQVLNITNVSRTGTASGNPLLKPITSRQLDLTAEWYFAQAGSLTLAVFGKRLNDVIIDQSTIYRLPDTTGKQQDFIVTSPVNGARGTVKGFEVGYQQYYDGLPGWLRGLGVQANYTYVDSRRKLYTPVYSAYCSGGSTGLDNVNLNMNGCDIDGRSFGDLPLPYLSKNTYNFTLLYDRGPWSARLAWSWRSKNFMSTTSNGTRGSDGTDTNPASATAGQHNVAWGLPLWADAYGQLDGGVSYSVNERIKIDLQAQNLTDAKYRQLMTQHIGDKGRAWFVTGPRYSIRLGYSFF